MAKVDPFIYSRPRPSVKTQIFTDSRYPDLKVELGFRSPDIVDYNTIQDVANTFLQFYSDKPFPSVDGKQVTLGPSLVGTCASMFVLQEVEDEANRYSMEELIALSVTLPTIFTDISQTIASLTEESELGKLIGVRLSSEPLPDSADDTHNLMSE